MHWLQMLQQLLHNRYQWRIHAMRPCGLSVVGLLAAISLQSTSNTRELNLLSPDAFSRDKMVKNVLVAPGLPGTLLGDPL